MLDMEQPSTGQFMSVYPDIRHWEGRDTVPAIFLFESS